MKVTKIGYIGASVHRYIDVLAEENVDEFKLIFFDNEVKNAKMLQFVVDKYFPELSSKLSMSEIPWIKFLNYVSSEVAKTPSINDIIKFLPTAFLHFILNHAIETDILWIGDNDFDTSFLFANLLNYFGIRYIFTLKETRYKDYPFELSVLKHAKRIYLPHEKYVDFFQEKYGIDVSSKTSFGDIDWRSKLVKDRIVSKLNVAKLSQTDGKAHVVILSGRAIWKKSEVRSEGRYYYLGIIKRLLEAGFVVHLHTKAIIESLDNPIVHKENPYTELQEKYKNKFFIEDPLDLNDPLNYSVLMRYDYGLVHSGEIPFDETIRKFEEINVPNRFFEYWVANVIPICPKGVLDWMEKSMKNHVIFFEEPDIYEIERKKSITKPFDNYFHNLIRSITEEYLYQI